MTKPRLLITGSNGLLGTSLVRQLAGKGVEIYASGRGANRTITTDLFDHPDIHYIPIDLLNGVELENQILEIRPQQIIHAGALTQVDYCENHWVECWNTNVTATRFIIEAAKKTNSALLFVSTDFVFSGEKGMYAETDEPGPVNYYGSSKLAAEKAVMSSGLIWSIVRTVLVYGNPAFSNRTNILTWVRDQLKDGKAIQVVDDQVRTPTYVEDLAEGIIRIVNKKAQGIFHISGAEVMTPFEMALKTAAYLQLDQSLISPVNASTFTQAAKRPLKTGFNISKARLELGYHPTPFDTAIEKVFE